MSVGACVCLTNWCSLVYLHCASQSVTWCSVAQHQHEEGTLAGSPKQHRLISEAGSALVQLTEMGAQMWRGGVMVFASSACAFLLDFISI